MTIRIGDNIKRLRMQRKVTQEQLAEALNVSSVAVSKWERGETMPDIALLPKLAYYFQVTIDELMSYDACAVELEIQEFLNAHARAAEENRFDDLLSLSADAYMRYPNDYRVMSCYMWDLAGGYADNDPAVLAEHADELETLCDRILDGCTDAFLRRDAYVMKGKLLHASGKTEEALSLYRKELPDWYQTAGQKSEQLFSKDTPEFAAALAGNITELGRFLLNKISKEIWFCRPELCTEEKTELAAKVCEDVMAFAALTEEQRKMLTAYFAGDFSLKLRAFGGDSAKKCLKRLEAYQ